MTQKRTLLAVGVAVLMFGSACAGGPSSRPDVAVEQNSPGTPDETTTDSAQDIPELQTPVDDLAWADCTQSTLDAYGLTPGTPGLVFDCADFESPVDASGEMFGSFSVGVMRARLGSTPSEAPPLVLTSGADRSSIATLADIAAGPSGTLLGANPVVAIDRRGIGRSTAVDCVKPDTRETLRGLGQFASSGNDVVDRAVDVGRDATIECTDLLQPQELAFATSYAADDLNQLRMAWGVDALGVIGTGNGASTALAYAARYPEHLARLVLDSPTGIGVDQMTLAEQKTQGREAAFAAFVLRCRALRCSLGDAPQDAVADLMGRATAGTLAPLSSHEVVDAIAYALSSSAGDASRRALDLSDTLSSARSGDVSELRQLASRAAAAYGTDGQFVARCTDGQQWPSPQSVRDAGATWAERYPIFGTDAAMTALTCASWPTAPAAPLPSSLSIPVLSLSGSGDPMVGNGGFAAVTGLVASTGTRSAAMTWQGSGHPVVGGSVCAQTAVAAYAVDAALPPDGSACPA
ncbi:alpha/beta hydrolase [Rhodococcoides kyotonense]|uniref:Alpha/beta hydrolase fold n=1 Tax=Rhodococcoides kyotonense TaxID=398843 RepID=A0A239CY16_9NOCA|nr:alpha/beta hydrolase [Rhodococcus kyotonensis]SNS24243.1 alpha/beta hydrolase fold [Rhodococcus kyotonensis]